MCDTGQSNSPGNSLAKTAGTMHGSSIPVTVTPPESSFTPIKDQELSTLEPNKGTSSCLDPVSSTTEETLDISPRERLVAQSRRLKRTCSRMLHDDDDNVNRSKRHFALPATPTASPFQTLRVTKSHVVSDRISLSRAEDASSYFNAPQEQSPRRQHPPGQTTLEKLNPCPTGTVTTSSTLGAIDAFQERSPNSPASASCTEQPTNLADFIASDATPSRGTANCDYEFVEEAAALVGLDVDANADPGDEYPLDDDLMEEDIACLLDATLNNVQETHIPPSSVTQAWDHDSRSAADYDPNLQYSSPFPSSWETRGSRAVDVAQKLDADQDDLLDDDIDWNAVYALTSTIPKALSTSGPQYIAHSSSADQTTHAEDSVQHKPVERGAVLVKPFVRPPFPEKVRDRSVVPGLSSSTLLRTCFRIGEMVNQIARCSNHNQEVIFELFARVTYSSRESLAKTQHFQFIDLFKDQQPYPAGVLHNWRVGSQLDQHSSAFLNKSNQYRLCHCHCKPRRDPKAIIGFVLVVLAIRETDWENIDWAKKVVCGDSGEQHGNAIPAKI
ncbi:hypothetical protein F4819DRAFT_271373 [Hypoxylon fuscum]|nr:hypothetical protein F4819DRAFT_271373 [Hypoxylon fuscum]